MNIAILAIFAAAALHFVYDAILAPSFRLNLRYQMFEQRDRLREIKVAGEVIDHDTFVAVHDMVNSGIQLVHFIDFFWPIRYRHLQHDPRQREEVERRKELIRTASPEVKKVADSLGTIITKAMAVNSFGFIITVIVPAILCVFCVHKVRAWIQDLLLTPRREVEQMGCIDRRLIAI